MPDAGGQGERRGEKGEPAGKLMAGISNALSSLLPLILYSGKDHAAAELERAE
jgi:hypothetical protein